MQHTYQYYEHVIWFTTKNWSPCAQCRITALHEILTFRESIQFIYFLPHPQSPTGCPCLNWIGGWTIVNNGYLLWPKLISLITSNDKRRFSRWLENVSKVVECILFDIMKGKFRISKNDVKAYNTAWKICCALHKICWNMMVLRKVEVQSEISWRRKELWRIWSFIFLWWSPKNTIKFS